jgi:hypothetical protein
MFQTQLVEKMKHTFYVHYTLSVSLTIFRIMKQKFLHFLTCIFNNLQWSSVHMQRLLINQEWSSEHVKRTKVLYF